MVAVVVLGITAAPAGASGRASGRASVRTAGLDAVVQRLGAGDASTVATPQQSPSPTDAIRGVKNHRDRRAWLESVATLIRDRSGDRVLVSGPAGGDSTEPEEPYVPVAGSFASATPAGDLDGDGGDDVVAYHFDLENYSTVLEARNGRSGATRWERASDDWSLLWPVRQDLTGDGRADLVELSLVILDEEYGDCDWEDDEDWCWPDEYSVTYRWDLSVVSGRDGATVWGRSYDGALTEVFTSDGEEPIPGLYQGSWTYEVTGTNIDVLPYLADLGADGAGEMVVNAIDLSYREHGDYQGAYPWLAGADYEEGGWQLRASTDVAVIDTATGTSGAETTEDSGGMIAILAPLADRGGSD
ncbi:MAG TPA: hypothetical protein VM307_15380, partial [Egibacteraceae bacterium]|nr:hypothetical protein [Egibacteraceae bacterium]